MHMDYAFVHMNFIIILYFFYFMIQYVMYGWIIHVCIYVFIFTIAAP